MSQRYDVIVIGAGLGGLSAAATLARAGLGVRLLERHTQPGGYATSFYRAPYEFEVSLHELSGIGTEGNRGPLWNKLEELGVTDRVDFVPIPVLYRSVAEGLDFELPADKEGALDALLTAFPKERRGVTRLMRQLYRIREDTQNLLGLPGHYPSTSQVVLKFPTLAHAATCPLSSLLYREIRDPLARLAIGQLWTYFGLPPSRLSLLYFAGAVTSFLTYGACYPRGKSQSLSNALADVIREAGGVVSLGNGARRILTEAGRVTGVVTDHEERLEAPMVVANVNPVTTALDLIGAEQMPPSFLERISRVEPSMSAVCVHLGLSADREQLGLRDHEVFVNGTLDPEAQYEAAGRLDPPDSFLITSYNVVHPEFSPSGTSVVSVSAPAIGRAWTDVQPDRYATLKHRFTEALVSGAAKRYPAFRDHLDVVVTTTPVTNMRYTGNPDGAIYGFAMTPQENPAFRLAQRGPLDGLYFAGAWTQPGGGYETTVGSGYDAAHLVLEALQQASARRGTSSGVSV
ncbi:MAG: NAD(P)/FAD-dependent oxidoreductase [bacterium]